MNNTQNEKKLVVKLDALFWIVVLKDITPQKLSTQMFKFINAINDVKSLAKIEINLLISIFVNKEVENQEHVCCKNRKILTFLDSDEHELLLLA